MAKLKKLVVFEVSLAAAPKTGKKFLLIKDSFDVKGGVKMDKVTKIMAYLASKSDNVPEVVREELKTLDSNVSLEDIREVFKDILPTESAKEDTQEKVAEIPEEVKKELDAYKAKLNELQLREFTHMVESKVGQKLADEFKPLYGKVDNATVEKLLDIVKFQQDIINELGKAQLSKENTHAKKVADVEKAVEALAAELKIPVTDAWVEYAKRNPTVIAELEQ